MKNKRHLKQRVKSIKGSFAANSESITFSLVDGSLVAIGDKGNIPINEFEVTTSYKREKKDKILNKVPSGLNDIDMNKVLSQYDFLYSIDSNTKEYNGNFITIGALIKGEFVKKDDLGIEVNYKCIRIMSSQSPYKFDRMVQYYWTEAIKLIQNELILYARPAIGLIIDCDLGNLNNYNNSKIPLYGNFYLPQNFKLIYASSDSGKESLPNKMIALADQQANKYFLDNYIKS